jgi:hypothetical protein
MATHDAIDRKFTDAHSGIQTTLTWQEVVCFDSLYYSGVVGMVGFWLLKGNQITPLQS